MRPGRGGVVRRCSRYSVILAVIVFPCEMTGMHIAAQCGRLGALKHFGSNDSGKDSVGNRETGTLEPAFFRGHGRSSAKV